MKRTALREARNGRFAAARTTDQRHDLAAIARQVQATMHPIATEARAQPTNTDHGRHQSGMPMLRVMMAKTASSRITKVIEVTTDAVVFADRLSVFGRTRRPK